MQTPVRVTHAEYIQARADFLRAKCIAWPGRRGLSCAECDREIYMAAATIEVHEANMANCYPTGATFDAAVPWCPHCEPEPAERGCVHG